MKFTSSAVVACLAASVIATPVFQGVAPTLDPESSEITTISPDGTKEVYKIVAVKQDADGKYKWYKPWTWFVKGANKDIEKGAKIVIGGIAGGIIGTIGFKVGDAIWKEIEMAHEE